MERSRRGSIHAQGKSKPLKPRRKRMEFSKILAAWAAALATITVAASFVLAAFEKQTVSDLSNVIFTACIGYLITYAGKSAYEKNSRNKAGLDENGQPLYHDDSEDD